MDLGIRGRTAIVCASSQGLGKGCALALAEAGVTLVINGRNQTLLEQTAQEIRTAWNVSVTPVLADVSTAEGQAALLKACPTPDILINNNAGPPLKDFRELDRQAILNGVTNNMVTPIELIQKVIDPMMNRGFARSVADKNVTINNLLPGNFDTQRLRSNLSFAAKRNQVSDAEATARAIANIPARRFGSAAELGQTCAFLCSVHAGFMTGQNVLVDGGAYPAAF
jgi:3-oxoacyl-[acyl-carrier protein] reductase